jgi:hypothetical protein
MSKIDEKDKIYLKELCELENLVYSQTVYTPENGQFLRSFKKYNISSKRAKITNFRNLYNKTLILYDLITRIKTSPCL